MTQYRVVTAFTDLTDNKVYHRDDLFPHGGIAVSDDRLEELSTTKNRRGIVLIETVYNEATENEQEKVEQEVIELPNFNQLNKKQIIEFGQSHNVDSLDMQMTKKELIATVERSL